MREIKERFARLMVCGLGLVLLGGTGCKGKPTQVQAAPKPVAPAPAPAVKEAPTTPIAEKKEELGGTTWNKEWDMVVERSLPGSLLSSRTARAVAGYCPRFAQEPEADKRAFWAYTFQALAGAEAGLNPTTTVHHTEAVLQRVDRVTHRPVRQEGLLQLTYDDDLRYGCGFSWAHDRGLPVKDPQRTILDPTKNLQCGIRIIDTQIVRQGKPLVTRTSYFATLQPGTESYAVFHKQMANVPVACGVGVMKPGRHATKERKRISHDAGVETARLAR